MATQDARVHIEARSWHVCRAVRAKSQPALVVVGAGKVLLRRGGSADRSATQHPIPNERKEALREHEGRVWSTELTLDTYWPCRAHVVVVEEALMKMKQGHPNPTVPLVIITLITLTSAAATRNERFTLPTSN